MSYDENESHKVKAENPLTPKQDNSWMEAIPLRQSPFGMPSKKPDTESALRGQHSDVSTSGSLQHDTESLSSPPTPSAVEGVSDVEAKPKTFADGYCEYCSNLSYPLTRALESTGVPTGADGWQQSYGPNKVKALKDHEYRLRRLLLALESGKPEEIEDAKRWAEFSFEFHTKIRQSLNAKAQAERDDQQ